MSLEGLGIKTPQDLPGKQIGDQPGSTNTVMFPVYANAVHIDPKSVTFLPSPPPALPKLLAAGKVQGIGQFVVGQPLIEKADPKHRKAVTLSYGDVLPQLYGNAILTRSDLAKDHPDQVKKFTGALLKGLQDTVTDPAGSAAILKKYVPDTDLAVATAELNIMKKYTKPEGFNGPLGDVTVDRVNTIISLLEQSKAIEKGSITPADVVTMSLAPKS